MTVFLCIASGIALVIMLATWIWEIKSKNSVRSRGPRLLATAVFTAIEVGVLTIRCLTGEEYILNLIIVLLGLANVVLHGFNMRG